MKDEQHTQKLDKWGSARRLQKERVEKLLKERDRLIGLISSGAFDDDEMALKRARANVKTVNWTVKSYKAGRRFRG